MLVTNLTSIHELSLLVSNASHVGDARHRVIESSKYHELDEPSRTRGHITNLIESHVGDGRYRGLDEPSQLDEPSPTL